MTHLVRITALIAVFAAAGCSVSLEVADSSPVAAAPSYSDMHSAIPASQTPGNVFEYSADISEATPVATNASPASVENKAFDYN